MEPFSNAVEQFEAERVCPRAGRTLIVGSRIYATRTDRRTRYPDAVGVDMLDGPGVDLVANLEDDLPEGIGTFTHIECMSVLEHSRQPWLLAANLERLMETDATIFVTVPFVWRVHAYPDDYFRFTINGLRALFNHIDWAAIRCAHIDLEETDKLPSITKDGHPYMARAEICAFGRRV